MIFSKLVKSRLTSPYSLSYSMFDDNADIIGHGAFQYHSKKDEPEWIINEDHAPKEEGNKLFSIFNMIYFMMKTVGIKGLLLMTARIIKLSIVCSEISKIINQTMPNRYETHQIAIKHDIRGKGHGSILLQHIHYQMRMNNKRNNVNLPCIGNCSTLKAKNFYVKN